MRAFRRPVLGWRDGQATQLDEAGHATSPAACCEPAESERHARREVEEQRTDNKIDPRGNLVTAKANVRFYAR